jgi:hypothetical protein
MPSCKVTLDQDTWERLVAVAVRERRPIAWQAEVLLIKAIYQASIPEAPTRQPSTMGTEADDAHP